MNLVNVVDVTSLNSKKGNEYEHKQVIEQQSKQHHDT